jgi:chromosome segregation ATPase
MEHDFLQQRLEKLDAQLEALERDIQAAGGAYRAALAGSPEKAKWNSEYERLVKEKVDVLSERRELEAKIPGDAVLFRFPPLSCSFSLL